MVFVDTQLEKPLKAVSVRKNSLGYYELLEELRTHNIGVEQMPRKLALKSKGLSGTAHAGRYVNQIVEAVFRTD